MQIPSQANINPGNSRSEENFGNVSVTTRLLSAVPYLVLLTLAWLVFGETTDDPFITFRYAANLCAGVGPVYNAGEHVEGFTSGLHMLACALLYVLLPGVGLLLKAKLLSLLCGLLMIYQTGRLARRLHFAPTSVGAAQMLLACNVNVAIASVNALETTLFAVLLLAGVTSYYDEMKQEHGAVSGLLLFLACFTRPEALLYAVVLFGLRCFWWRRRRLPAHFIGAWLLGFALPLAICLAFRLWYFGYPFPNTYYAKAVPWSYGLANGLPYLRRPFLAHEVTAGAFSWQMMGVAAYWAGALLGLRRKPREISNVLFSLLVLGNIVFVLKTGGDWMNGCRFLLPVLPYITLLQVRGTGEWLHGLRPELQRRVGAGVAALGLTLLLAGIREFGFYPLKWRGGVGDDALLASGSYPYAPTWITIGRFIHSELRPGATIAYSEAGYASYINRDKHFLDTFGLTDGEISHARGVERCRFGVVTMFWNPPNDPIQQILRRRAPDYVIIGSVAMPTPMPPRLMQDYEPMPIPSRWKDALSKTQFGFYRRRSEAHLPHE